MFEGNIITFNRGWDQSWHDTAEYDDARAIKKRLKDSCVNLSAECDENSTAPAHITLKDPDGNQILIDQHK